MRTLRYEFLGPIQRLANGGRSPVKDIRRGVKTHALLLSTEYNVDIVGASGGNVNAEGTARLIRAVRIMENGVVTCELSGRQLAFATSKAQKQAANIGALANANAQSGTVVRADFVLEFAAITGADPSETAYVERDSSFPTQIEIDFEPDAQAALISGTGLTLNSMTVEVTQVFDPVSRRMPFYIPRIRRSTSNAIVGTVSRFPVLLYPEGMNRVAGHLLHALVDGATNASVLNGAVTYRGDKTRYIDNVPFRALLNEQRRFMDAVAPSAGYLWLENRFYGKLSEMYFAGQDANLRAELDVTNPGAAASFDILSFEMEPIPGYTSQLPNGW